MLIDDRQLNIVRPECYHMAKTVNCPAGQPDDISKIFPYLNAVVKRSGFYKDAYFIQFNFKKKPDTLHPRQIAARRISGRGEAEWLLENLKETINDVYEKRDDTELNYKRRDTLKALDIFKLLSRTNCLKRGEAYCHTLAMKLLSEKKSIIECSPLFTEEFSESKKLLVERMSEAGCDLQEERLSAGVTGEKVG